MNDGVHDKLRDARSHGGGSAQFFLGDLTAQTSMSVWSGTRGMALCLWDRLEHGKVLG
jgi:hypothetical protein